MELSVAAPVSVGALVNTKGPSRGSAVLKVLHRMYTGLISTCPQQRNSIVVIVISTTHEF